MVIRSVSDSVDIAEELCVGNSVVFRSIDDLVYKCMMVEWQNKDILSFKDPSGDIGNFASEAKHTKRASDEGVSPFLHSIKVFRNQLYSIAFACIVTDYCGTPLNNINTLDEEDKFRLVLKAAVNISNFLGLIHSDLHLSNILYDSRSGLVTVIDWALVYRPRFKEINDERFYNLYYQIVMINNRLGLTFPKQLSLVNQQAFKVLNSYWPQSQIVRFNGQRCHSVTHLIQLTIHSLL